MQKGKNGTMGVGGTFLICLLISFGVMLIVAVIGGAIAYLTDDPTAYIPPIALAAILLSAVINGACSSRIKGDGGVGFSVLVALALMLLLLLINVIINGGKVGGGAFMNYGCYLATAALAAYLGRVRQRKRRRR